jgi:hypothetical protein
MSMATGWRKSSHSTGNGGNCIETRSTADRLLIRDTKDKGCGPVLSVSPAEWQRFTASIKCQRRG